MYSSVHIASTETVFVSCFVVLSLLLEGTLSSYNFFSTNIDQENNIIYSHFPVLLGFELLATVYKCSYFTAMIRIV